MKLPRGTHVKPEKIENFYHICKQLDSDFTGALRLRGVKEEKTYNADLLIDVGSVIAASFHYTELKKKLLRDDALEYIRNNLSGSSGKLDIFDFDSEEMRRSIESNSESLIEDDVRVHDLGVKIKSKIVSKKPGMGVFSKISSFIRKPDLGKKNERVKEIKGLRDEFKKIDEHKDIGIGHKVKEDGSEEKPRLNFRAPKILSGGPSIHEVHSEQSAQPLNAQPTESGTSFPSKFLKKKIPTKDDLRKGERMQTIKESRLAKIRARISLEKESHKNVKKIVEGMKVKTTIDKLYEWILDNGEVKIDDHLSTKLGVSKTQIEEWCMILEEHNLVELHYPAIGDPEARKMHEDKEGDELGK